MNWLRLKKEMDDAIVDGGFDQFALTGERAKVFLQTNHKEKPAGYYGQEGPKPRAIHNVFPLKYRGYDVRCNPEDTTSRIIRVKNHGR